MFQRLQRELTEVRGHQKTTVQPFISLRMCLSSSPQASRVCHGRFYRPMILSLLITPPCTPHQTIASFSGLDGRWSQCGCNAGQEHCPPLQCIWWCREPLPRGIASQRRCPVMGHEAVTRTWVQDTGIRCSHTFLLAWISHFGGHTLTCLF